MRAKFSSPAKTTTARALLAAAWLLVIAVAIYYAWRVLAG
jgi:hypothetical protein